MSCGTRSRRLRLEPKTLVDTFNCATTAGAEVGAAASVLAPTGFQEDDAVLHSHQASAICTS